MKFAVLSLSKGLVRKLSILKLSAPLSSVLSRNSHTAVQMSSNAMKEHSGDEKKHGLLISEVTSRLESWAPLWLAGSWDKVGLQVEPSGTSNRVSRILLTNDLTEAVVREAIENGPFGMIISYHPPIFRALKTLTNRHWKERVITACIENKIAVYSPHTAWDAVEGGVNDWLASAFVDAKVKPLTVSQHWSHPSLTGKKVTHRVEIVVPDNDEQLGSFSEMLSECANDIGAGIHDMRDTSDGNKVISFECTEESVHRLIKCVKSWPLKPLNLHFRVSKYEKIPLPEFGEGRLCTLSHPKSLKEIVETVKGHLKLSGVRLAVAEGLNIDSPVHTVALCAGSGSSVLSGVKADVYWTGEMGHHEVLEATHKGSHVILCEHSNTERGFLYHLVEKGVLHQLFDGCVDVVVSSKDQESLQIV